MKKCYRPCNEASVLLECGHIYSGGGTLRKNGKEYQDCAECETWRKIVGKPTWLDFIQWIRSQKMVQEQLFLLEIQTPSV